VEGVSLIATQRSEFGAVLAKGGIDHLIEQLIAKSKLGAAAINETTAKH
jgi:ABC-type transporter MlaC component